MTDQSNDNVDTATTENNSADSQEMDTATATSEAEQEQSQDQTKGEQANDDQADGKGEAKQDAERPKKSRAQERIEQTTRENAELKRKLAEYESKQQTTELKRPKIDDFDQYSDYEDALDDYYDKRAKQNWERSNSEHQAKQAQSQKQAEMETAIAQFAETISDFDQVVQTGLQRNYPMPVTLDEVASEFNYDSDTQVRLLYELAKDDAFHQEVSASSKLKAARLLSERVDSWSAKKPAPSVSKAPPPLKPVQANASTARDESKMSDDEWYRAKTQSRKGK